MANYWECKLEAAPEVLNSLVNEDKGDFNWHAVLDVPEEGDNLICTADHSTGDYTTDGKPILSECQFTWVLRLDPLTLDYEVTKNPSPTLNDWFECHVGRGPAHGELYRRERHVSFSSRGGVLSRHFLLTLSRRFPRQAMTYKACDPAVDGGWVVTLLAGEVINEWESGAWGSHDDARYLRLERELMGDEWSDSLQSDEMAVFSRDEDGQIVKLEGR